MPARRRDRRRFRLPARPPTSRRPAPRCLTTPTAPTVPTVRTREFVSPAPREALEYFRFRGLKIGFDYRDVRPGEHALAFTVAKAMEFDLLKEIRAALDRALGEGMTFRRFEQALTPLLKERGWWGEREMTDPLTGKQVVAELGSPRRLRILYGANLRAARAAGLWIRAQRTKDADPYFLYEPGPDEACAPHRAWAGTLLPVDHPWWDDHFPPNGWDCDCRARLVGEAEARRRGGPTEPPPRRETARRNERTLRFDRVDAGLDPAWATNPGKLWAEGPLGPLGGDFGPADEAYARAAIQSVLESPILYRFMEEPRGDLVAGVFDEQVRRWIGAETRFARLPEEIMRKQLGRWSKKRPDGELRYQGHELTAFEYRLLPHLIEKPQLVMRSMPALRISRERLSLRLNLISAVHGACYNTVVGRFPGDPTRVGIITFHEIDGGRTRVERMIDQATDGLDGQAVLRNSLPLGP